MSVGAIRRTLACLTRGTFSARRKIPSRPRERNNRDKTRTKSRRVSPPEQKRNPTAFLSARTGRNPIVLFLHPNPEQKEIPPRFPPPDLNEISPRFFFPPDQNEISPRFFLLPTKTKFRRVFSPLEQVSRGPQFRKDAGPVYLVTANDKKQQQSRVWFVLRSGEPEYRNQNAPSILDNTPPSTGKIPPRSSRSQPLNDYSIAVVFGL